MTNLIKRGMFHLSSPAGLYEQDTESQDKRIHTRFSRVVHVVCVFDLIASGGIVFLLFFFKNLPCASVRKQCVDCEETTGSVNT